ncbi:MAG: YfhO family protein [Archangium sp.]|nr:YfhO family protein [Archangium sp.]
MERTRAQLLVTCLVSLGLPLALYGGALFGDGAFFYRDVFRQYWPVQEAVSRAWASGHLPLWNDATQGGVPLWANLHAGVLSPSFIAFRVVEFHRAYAWLVWLHHAALVLGWYVALRARVSDVAAAAGAVAIGLSAYAVGLSNYLAMLVGMACMGWQVAAVARLPRAPLRIAAVSGLFALQVLAGDALPAMLSAMVLAAWVLTETPERRWSLLRDVVSAGVLALVVCAAQLMPAWELLHESVRATVNRNAALAWSFHPRRFLEWVVETPFGNYGDGGFRDTTVSRGPDTRPFLMSHHLGVVTVMASIVGVALRRGRATAGAVALLALGVFLSVGDFFEPSAWLLQQPPFSFFKYPEKYQWLCVVGAGWLAAAGVEALQARRAGAWWWAVPAVMVLELGLGASRLVWLVPHDVLHEAPETLAQVKGSPGRLWRATLDFTTSDPNGLNLDEAVAERRFETQSWASALPTLHGVPELGGYSPVALARWQRVIRGLYDAPDALYRMFGVRWVVTSPGRIRPTRFGIGAHAELTPGRILYEYKEPVPRLFAVREAVSVADLDEAITRMHVVGFDPRQTAVVEGAPPRVETMGQVTLGPLRAGALEARVETSDDTLVVASETFSSGWRAFLDEAEVPVLAVDGTLMGVAVPQGTHQVRFEYAQPGLALGAVLSGVGVAVLLALAWLGRRRGATSVATS